MARRVQLNLTEVEEFGGNRGGFELLPPERSPYGFKVTDVDEGVSNAGNPKMVMRLEVVDPQDMAGKTPTFSYSLVDKVLPKQRLKSLVNACGVEYDRGGFDMDDLIGTHFSADIIIEEYNGREFNRLENVGPYDAFGDGGDEAAGGDTDGEPAGEEPPEEPRRTARTAPTRTAPSRSGTRRLR